MPNSPSPGAAPEWIPLERYDPGVPPEEATARFLEVMQKRRTVRMFSDRPVSREVVENLVRVGMTAPSGANKQPWRFVCVKDAGLKREIRFAAEQEEREFYSRRASADWLADLAPLGTDENKEFLETAPWLIVVFKLVKGDDGSPTYYTNESVGIAVGMVLAAAHFAGLATVTHTPSPMHFLCDVLKRPGNERPYLVIPLGYPAEGCVVPRFATTRKGIGEVMVVDRG